MNNWLHGPVAVALVAMSLAACTLDSAPAVGANDSPPGAAPPAQDPAIEAWTVPLPSDIAFVYPRTPTFIARDGSDLVFTYNTTTSEKRELGYIRIDGSGFRCLTCGTEFVGETPYSFGDQRRVLIQQASNQSSGQQSHVVLDCRPSIADCQSLSGKPVIGIAGGSRVQSLQDRVVEVAPAGDALVWSRIRIDGYFMLLGRLSEQADHYQVQDIRMVNPPPDPALGEIGPVLAESAWYEAKGIGSDGRTLTFTATLGESLNFDWYTMDLVTGITQRQTTDPDWDEGGVPSPDLTMYKGARALFPEIAAYGTLPRPGLLDFAIVGPLSNYYLPRHLPLPLPARERKVRHGLHVFDAQGERPGYRGLAVSAADDAEGWINSGQADVAAWSLDGRRLTVGQRKPEDGINTRLRIFTFVNRAAVQVSPQPTVFPDWAPRIEELAVRSRLATRLLQGPAGGSATLAMQGNLLEGVFSVVYRNYSTDGCSFLNGSQSLVGAVAINAVYRERLRLSGCRRGESEAEVLFGDFATSGKVLSVFEGRRFEVDYGRE